MPRPDERLVEIRHIAKSPPLEAGLQCLGDMPWVSRATAIWPDDRDVAIARPKVKRSTTTLNTPTKYCLLGLANIGWTLRSSPDQFRHSHDVMFSIRYCATASSAANVRPTPTEGICQTNEGADQMNCLRNSRSGAFSLSRVKTISKYPLALSVQPEASTDTTALHVRSSVGDIMAENSTSLTVKVGRQRFSPIA